MKVGEVGPESGPRKAAGKGGRGSRHVGSLGGRGWWGGEFEEKLLLDLVRVYSPKPGKVGSEVGQNSHED